MRHKHADLIHAWADGAQIEIKHDEGWVDASNPRWNENFQYRIKAEPKPDFVHKTRIKSHYPFKSEVSFDVGVANIQLTFDGETGELKSAEVIK